MRCADHGSFASTEKTIHDEEVSNVDIVESMSELKVGLIGLKWTELHAS